MARIEVFDSEGDILLFDMDLDFMPRVGETISKDAGGYFAYYEVLDVWYREELPSGKFVPCVAARLNE